MIKKNINKQIRFKNFVFKRKQKKINSLIKKNEIISTSIKHFYNFKKNNMLHNVNDFKTNLLIISNEKHDSVLFDDVLKKLENAINNRNVLIFEKLKFLINWKQLAKIKISITNPVLENLTENLTSLTSFNLENEKEKKLFDNLQYLIANEINTYGFAINFFDKFIVTKNEKNNYKILFSEKILFNYENTK